MVKFLKTVSSALIILCAASASASSILKVGLALPYATLDPAKYIDTRSIFVASQIFEPLLRIGPHGDLIPWIADSWVVSEDRKTYIFRLKKNIHFATGKPVTCNDVKYSFARTIAARADRLTFLKELTGYQNINLNKLDDWTGCRCISNSELVILLKSPSAFFIYALSDPALYILPAIEDKTIRDGSFFTRTPYGTGPFLAIQVGDKKIDLSSNENYWGNNGVYSSIQISVISKPDEIYNLDALLFDSNVDIFSNSIFHKQSYRSPSIAFLGLNVKRPPWKNIENRKLLIESINWNIVRASAYPDSYGRLSGSIIPYGVIGHDPNLQPYAYNPNFEKLEKLFKQYPSAKQLVVSTKADLIALQNSLSKIQPSEASLEPIPDSPGKIVQIIKDHELQTFVIRPFMNYPDAFLLLEYFQTDNPMNFLGWSSREYDNLLDQARKSDGRYEKYEIYRHLAMLLRDAYNVVPIQSQLNQEIWVRNDVLFDKLTDENIMYYQLNRVKHAKNNP